MNRVRLTLVVEMDEGYEGDTEFVSFCSLPEGAHYALDHGTIVSVTSERIDPNRPDRETEPRL